MKKLSRKLGMLVLGAMMGGTALLATPNDAAAQNPWWFYIDGGYTILTGDSGDLYKDGFQVDVAFGQIIAQRFAIGLFGGAGFHSGESLGGLLGISELGKATVWRYGLWGGVNALQPSNPWAVWFGGGVGLGTISLGDSKDDQGADIPNSGSSTTDFMLQGNLAASYQVGPKVALGVNGTFYIIFTEGSSWTGIPLTAYVSITP